MASLDDLAADQRAVLQMVLRRGRTYDQIAGVLSIDRSAVRQRALDALDALTPDGIAPGPEQALVTDYLLSQLPEQVAAEVYAYLEAADDDRAWAGALAGRLAQLASSPLPEIPVAAPLRRDEPAVVGHRQRPYARRDPHPPGAGPATAAAPRRHDPRLMAFLGAAALTTAVAVVAVVVLVVIGSSSSKPRRAQTRTASTGNVLTPTTSSTVTAATTTTTAGSQPQILAALNLTSPTGVTRTLGVAQVVRDRGVVGIVIDAQGVPQNSAHNAYGLWLYNSAMSHQFVGFDPNLVKKNGKFALEGALPPDASRYRRLLITLETRQHPQTPGEVVLSGPFREK